MRGTISPFHTTNIPGTPSKFRNVPDMEKYDKCFLDTERPIEDLAGIL